MATAEPRNLLLTTTGRRSGQPHAVELWFVRREGKVYVATDMCRLRDWCANLLRNPQARVEIGGQTSACRARLVEEPELKQQVTMLRRQKYGSAWASLTSDIIELITEEKA